MEIRLVITHTESGKVDERDCTFDEPLVLGRGPASPIQLEGPFISREHFALTYADGRITLRDLSSNGTWFKGQRLSKESQLEVKHGDFVEVPGYRVEIRIPNQESPENVTAAPPDTLDEPEEKSRPNLLWLEPVRQFLGSLSGLEVFVSLAAICCFGIVVLYALN